MSEPASNSSSAAFLLFKLRHIGDVLLTTPSIRLLRRSFPRAHITMVVNKGTEDVLRYNPHLNEVLTVDRATGVAGQWRLLRTLRRRRYAASVDFASGDRAAWLAFFSGAPRRIALWSPEGARRMLNNKPLQMPASPFHIVELYLSFVERGLALHTEDRALELPVGGEEDAKAAALLRKSGVEGRFVALHVGARSNAAFRWPRERWMEFAQTVMQTRGMVPVFVGGEDCRDDVHWILSQPGMRAVSLVGRTSILELAAVLKRAAGFVGIASGPMHLAAAVGTPVVCLYVDDIAWRPWGAGHAVLRAGREGAEQYVTVMEAVDSLTNLSCRQTGL